MLHRAAKSAYSWWWASHIRTKQSKWLEQNLQDMEEKVKFMLRIIEQEGDSFAKRAEMYYKKRPELINSVEETYRAYRALAERFDHLSKDLQSANRTIATVFPEQVQLSMESEDEDNFSGSTAPPDNLLTRSSSQLAKNMPKAPKLPTPKTPNSKAHALLASKREQLRRNLTTAGTVQTPNSGLSKEEALKEIDTYEKEILSMQTEKEFMKSAYESALAKFLELESKITESQTKVCNLQDEFGVGAVIEDHEARKLMAGSALRSCAETLTKLQDEQAKSIDEVKEEYKKIKEAYEKIESLKELCGQKDETPKDQGTILGSNFKETLVSIEMKEGEENVEALREKIKEELKISSNSAFTEPELTEKIDDLVEKVVHLETTVCSQNALVKRLRQEIEGLMGHIKNLEEQKEKLQEDSAMRNKLRELEEELIKVRNLNNEVVETKNNIDEEITEASCNLDHLQEKLKDVKPYDEKSEQVAVEAELQKDEKLAHVAGEAKPQKEESAENFSEQENYGCDLEQQSEMKVVEDDDEEKQDMSRAAESTNENDIQLDQEGGINWRQFYVNNMEDRERILVEEYTIILRDYKDMKMKLSEMEKQHRDNIYDLTCHTRELRNTIAAKDEEIRMLRKKLGSLLENDDEDFLDSWLEENASIKDDIESETKGTHSKKSSFDSIDPDRKPLFHLLYDREEVIKPPIDEDEIERQKANALGNEGMVKKVKINPVAKTRPVSRTEGKYRAELDNLLEANLDFWLRFSTAFHQIQKFQNSIKDLQADLTKLKHPQKKGGNEMTLNQIKSDARPLYKHLREIQTELTLWLEHSAVFQEELRSRFSSLNNMQDEITKVINLKTREENELSDVQAAKFQGEIINMKQENSKVAEELQAGIYRVRALKFEIGKSLMKLDKEFGFSGKSSVKNPSLLKPKIPLHTFLFGMKLKKHKKQPSQSMHMVSKDNLSPLLERP